MGNITRQYIWGVVLMGNITRQYIWCCING